MRMLLVEDSPADAELIRELLSDYPQHGFSIQHVGALGAALAALGDGPDLVLLDLGLPDSHGMETVRAVREAAPTTPIVVLTGIDDEDVGVRTLKEGAQDYLAKGWLNGPALIRSIRYAQERNRFEAELIRKNAELERSNAELQRFAYVASHDLQEPLRSIVSFSQLLERRYKGQLDSDADEYIGFIVEGGNRMQALIQDLLTVSRVTTQAAPIVETDANAVLTCIVRDLSGAIEDAKATVTVASVPPVMADTVQLEQVFTNLIGNALKYRALDRAPEVRVSGRRDGSTVEFAVQDNGIGIEAEYHDRIFEMFRRLHTHDEYEGTGIGLAIVKKIVERHSGRVWVESTPGEGSTFYFTLAAA